MITWQLLLRLFSPIGAAAAKFSQAVEAEGSLALALLSGGSVVSLFVDTEVKSRPLCTQS